MALSHEQHPEFFDLPGDRRPRKIFRAIGTKLVSHKGAKKRWQDSEVYVNAPTLAIAQRTAKRYLLKVYRAKLVSCYEISLREYAEVMRRAGANIEFPEDRLKLSA